MAGRIRKKRQNMEQKNRLILFGAYPKNLVKYERTVEALEHGSIRLPDTAEALRIQKSLNRIFRLYEPSVKDVSLPDARRFRGFKTSQGILWFQFESIRWEVIQEEEDTMTLLSADILDTQFFNPCIQDDGSEEDFGHYRILNTVHPANVFADSFLEYWLNTVFRETAFNAQEKERLIVDDSGGHVLCYPRYADGMKYGIKAAGRSIYTKTQTEHRLTEYAKSRGPDTNYWWLDEPLNRVLKDPYSEGKSVAVGTDINRMNILDADRIAGVVPMIRIRKQ